MDKNLGTAFHYSIRHWMVHERSQTHSSGVGFALGLCRTHNISANSRNSVPSGIRSSICVLVQKEIRGGAHRARKQDQAEADLSTRLADAVRAGDSTGVLRDS